MRIIEQMQLKVQKHQKAGKDITLPRFGILKLGTGNGWAGLLQTPPSVEPIWALRQVAETDLKFTRFNMIEAEGRVFHFGGFGADALILNDYIDIKNKYTKGFRLKLVNSLFGYLYAMFTRSIPTLLFKGFKLKLRVTNLSDEPLYTVNHSDGIKESPIKKGETIYEGPADACIFGTTSDYGFGVKVMPFAMDKPGHFMLRVAAPGIKVLLKNIRAVWNGTIDHPDIHDFLVKKVRIELEADGPFQLGGDPEGYRKSVDLEVSDFAPEVLDFR
jgi:diacylglycerol kinase family enzyme